MSSTENIIKPHLSEHFLPQVSRVFPKYSAGQQYAAALAAYAISKCAGVVVGQAVDAVTDGSQDYGVDAFLFKQEEQRAYIVQSKVQNETNGVQKGEVLKFLEGIDKIISNELDGFNERMAEKQDQVTQLTESTESKISLILISTGTPLEKEIQDCFDKFLQKHNSTDDNWISFEHLEIEKVKDFILEDKSPKPIEESFEIFNWNEISTPIKCIYGQVSSHTIGS